MELFDIDCVTPVHFGANAVRPSSNQYLIAVSNFIMLFVIKGFLVSASLTLGSSQRHSFERDSPSWMRCRNCLGPLREPTAIPVDESVRLVRSACTTGKHGARSQANGRTYDNSVIPTLKKLQSDKVDCI